MDKAHCSIDNNMITSYADSLSSELLFSFIVILFETSSLKLLVWSIRPDVMGNARDMAGLPVYISFTRYQTINSLRTSEITPGPLSLTWITFDTSMGAWICNCIHCKMWDGITYPFPNFNGTTVEVWEWVSNFIPHFNAHVITYPWWD